MEADDDDALPEGDARLEHGLDGAAPSFVSWLVVMAPLHARAFLPPWSPLRRAILDMRAAALRSADGDPPGNVWLLNEPAAAFDDLSQVLSGATGLTPSRGLFDAVWRLYLDHLEGVGREGGYGINWNHVAADDYEAHLLGVAADTVRLLSHLNHYPRWSLEEALADAHRRRYGCDPDAKPTR